MVHNHSKLWSTAKLTAPIDLSGKKTYRYILVWLESINLKTRYGCGKKSVSDPKYMIADIAKVRVIWRKKVSMYPFHLSEAPNLFHTNGSRLQCTVIDLKGEKCFATAPLMPHWLPPPLKFWRCSRSPCISVVAPNPFYPRSGGKVSLVDDISGLSCICGTKAISWRYYWLLISQVWVVFVVNRVTIEYGDCAQWSSGSSVWSSDQSSQIILNVPDRHIGLPYLLSLLC